MKRIIAVIAALSLIAAACLCPACAAAGEETDAVIRMMNDLLAYVYQSEVIFDDLEWALEAFERFEAERSWETLQLARASLVIARKDIERRAVPEPQLTAEDLKELMDRGMDVSFMEENADSFTADRTYLLNAFGILNIDIMRRVFLEDDWELCLRRITVMREMRDCTLQYLANTANWVLAAVDNDATTDEFNALMREYCPEVSSRQAETGLDPEAIIASNSSVMDRMDKLSLEYAKLQGASESRGDIMTELLRQGDTAEIGESILEISGLPLLVSMPEWFSDSDVTYYWNENGQIADMPTARTALERIPDVCRYRIGDVTEEAVRSYQAALEAGGLACSEYTEEEGKLHIHYEYADSIFSLIWENGETSIVMTENPICFVPQWYLPAKHTVS